MFKGKWITTKERQSNLHFIFERQFDLADFSTAKIRITADDYYKLYVNGCYAGQGPAPSYSFNYRFNEFDLTDYLQAGKNTLTVHCYYQGLTNRRWVSGDGNSGLIADLLIDGAPLICTDGSWLYRIDGSFTGGKPTGYDTAFPENRDMRITLTEPKNAVEIPCPHRFADDAFPALETYEITAEPKQSGGRYFYDFKQEYVCTPIIKARSDADGARLLLHFAEELSPDGKPRFNLRCGCSYEEEITLKKGENRIEQYDYKALRYAEIICDDGCAVEELKIRVQHYPFPEKSQEPSGNNDRLNAVWGLCKNTVKLGAQEALIDCPTREKGQYIGDAYISGFAHFYLTGKADLLKKALRDFADSAEPCGETLAVAPCAYRQKIADYSLLFAPMVLKYLRITKDGEFAKGLISVCDKINSYYAGYENENGLLADVDCSWNLVDWPENMRDGYQYNLQNGKEIGTHCVINAHYVHSLKCTEELKALADNDFESKADEKAEEFNRIFFDKKSGLYVDCEGSIHSAVHSNLLPLAFGICPEEHRNAVADYLEKRGMQCSVYMAYFYLRALCEAGRKQAALDALLSDGKNSWLNMIKEGATTAFEAWGKERKWNTSLFHPWAVAPILIINEYFPDLIDK